ncbi:(2Fe-2S)-binding protein [Cohnella sp.]|uniref:(2Fe-2S)-binding protein n=1 Tax=Cohnella sp. TaxID=1883426 RepID=UPI0035690233
MIDKGLATSTYDQQISFSLNGSSQSLRAPASKRLLSVLRNDLLLTGTKRSCEIGRCGACIVLMDGKPVNSCLTMMYQVEGKEVTTIEGLAETTAVMHPVQQAFLEEGGYQCGYCTPGMILSVTALLDEFPEPTSEQVEEALSGNLCRCTGYGGILRAVMRAIEMGRDANGRA